MNASLPTQNWLQDSYARFLSSVWFPLAFTLFVFLFKAPYMDLPVYDDGATFYNGWRILNGDFGALNFQWSPLLTFLCAAIQVVLPEHPIEGFFLFHALGHVFIALGGYAMLRVLDVEERYAAPLAAAWCGFIHAMGVMMEFPTLHLYHTGVPLLVGAYFLQKKPVSLMTGLGLSALLFLLRNEAVLVMLILLAAGAMRRRSIEAPLWKRNVAASLVVWIALGASLWAMNQDARNWQAERMQQAFRQKFYVYALSTVQFDAVYPMTYEAEFRVLENAFGDGADELSVPQLLLRNPGAFLGFMGMNVQMVLNGELGYDDHHWLISYYISVLFVLGCLALGAAAVRRRQWWIALLLFTVLLKVPLLLITVPRVRYFGDALFIALFAAWPLLNARRGARWSDGVASGLVCLAAYSFFFLPAIKPLGVRPNMDRALFVRYADPFLDFENKSIAENYPTFSTAFGSRGFRESFPADDFVYQYGDLLYGRDGRVCDYILLEDGLPVVAGIGKWGSSHTPLLSQGRFHLYAQSEGGEAVEIHNEQDLAVWTTDDYLSEDILDGRLDFDEYPHPDVAVKWDLTRMAIEDIRSVSDVHLYVEINGGDEMQPLGAPYQVQAPFFEWTANSPLVNPAMQSGPAFGAAYRFGVFVRLAGQEHFRPPWMTSEPVRFQSFLTVHDSIDSRIDLSDGFDVDDEDARNLVIRWNLPPDVLQSYQIIDFHVYVRSRGAEAIQYLGQTMSGDVFHLEWKPGNPGIAPDFRNGPQFGNEYEFLVYIIPEERMKTPKAPYRTFGPVRYFNTAQAGESLPTVTAQANKDGVAVRWQYDDAWLSEHPVNGFDVYVHQKGSEDVLFLGRSGVENPGALQWRKDNPSLAERFQTRQPSYGEYEFAVYPLMNTMSGMVGPAYSPFIQLPSNW
ncbi:MAG: hypothetical protein P9L94_20365 [Candidatus Hinthialibacter antarcticus]|nr:hypothetical protein [Candidatus Hinthialibacter antarcticus]